MKTKILLILLFTSSHVSFAMKSAEAQEGSPKYDRPLNKKEQLDAVNRLYQSRMRSVLVEGSAADLTDYVSNADNIKEMLGDDSWKWNQETPLHYIANTSIHLYSAEKAKQIQAQLLEKLRVLMTTIAMEERQKIKNIHQPVTPALINRLVDDHMKTIEEIVTIQNHRGKTAYQMALDTRNLQLAEFLDPNNRRVRESLRPVIEENIRQILNVK